jgi:ribosome-associated translation inhibitor RaiA
MDPSEAVETLVREKAGKLDRVFNHLTSCRVIIGTPHRSKVHSKTYHITIEMGVPGRRELVVTHEPDDNPGREDAYAAVRDAFDKAQRRLQDYASQMEGKTKRQNPV